MEIWYNKLLESNVKSMSSEYRILKHFGPSGHGQLFLAITSENFLVALKIILEKRYVEIEVEQMKQIKKKCVESCLPFIDYFILQQDGDQCYIIVMKYFEGYIILSDYLNKNPFHLENLAGIKLQIKKQMEMIHQNQIAHNDIDLGNILIHSKSGIVKIIDLGFCIYKFDITNEQFKLAVQRDLHLIDNL